MTDETLRPSFMLHTTGLAAREAERVQFAGDARKGREKGRACLTGMSLTMYELHLIWVLALCTLCHDETMTCRLLDRKTSATHLDRAVLAL